MSETDPTMQVRLDVAEIKGMLTQSISNHEARLSNLETKTNNHDMRINEKGTHIARHDERIHDLENDMKESKDDTKSKEAKALSTFSLIIAGVIALITVYNFFTGTPIGG